MGPIQSSLNQLTLSALGAIAGVAKGVKGGFEKPKAPGVPAQESKPLPAAKVSDYAVQGEATYTVGSSLEKSALMANIAGMSGNDVIQQKHRASANKVKERLASIRKRKMGR